MMSKLRKMVIGKEVCGIVHLAIWFGLLVGLAEVSIRAVQVFVFYQWIWLSPHVVWMAPLADVCLLVFAGSVFLVGRLLWPALASFRNVVCVFTFLGLLGPLLYIERVHWLASVLLALGLATQTARVVAARADEFQLWVRRTTVPLVTIVAVLALVVTGWRLFETRSAVANLAPAPAGAPNVLLIVLDTVRAQSLSLYGYTRRTTPQLEQIAKTGVVFEHAVSTAPWTLPAHGSLFTGRYPHELSADWLTPLDGAYPTLAEVFSSYGYVTAGFIANFLYCTYETGLNRGFIHYEDYPVSLGMIVHSSWLARTIVERLQPIIGSRESLIHKSAEDVNKGFLHWLSYKNERPFLVFLNYMDAHSPYLPPSPFDVMFGSKRARPDHSKRRHWSEQEIQVERDAYDNSIAYLDHQLGVLFDKLKKQGFFENSLIIITSDHGEQFGEHGFFEHGNNLYLPSLHVPLLILFPNRVPSSKRITNPVSLRDLPATVIDLIKLKGDARFPGKSLARYWGKRGNGAEDPSVEMILSEVTGHTRTSDWYPIVKGDMKSLMTQRYHYIRNGDGREELYDIDLDVAQRHDLAGSPKSALLLESFRKSLAALLKAGLSQ